MMKGTKTCVIFCAGDCAENEHPVAHDLLIAADGGLRHTQKLGLTPDITLGDFDSLGYIPENAQVFPVEKDDPDSMLAARCALAQGYREIWVYGGLDGSRIDHTVANFQMLDFLAENGAHGTLVGATQMATVIRNGTFSFPPREDGIFSVFCLGADASGVSISGGQYPLQNGTLRAGFPLGLSNHFIGDSVEISVKDGSLLIIWEK